MLAQVALSAIAHAKGAVDEEFQLATDGRTDGADLLQRELALQHQPREAQRLQLARPLRRADGCLRGGVQLHGRKRTLQQAQVLDDEHIDSGFVERPHQALCLGQFFVFDKRVDRSVDLRAVEMSVAAQTGDIFNGVARSRPRTERRPGDINGIGTTVDRRDADIRVSRRSEKFQFL